jgi:hypothetical protein
MQTSVPLVHRLAPAFLALASGCLLSVSAARAAELTLKVVDKPPPAQLDASIRGLLQSQAVQLLDGEAPVYEFWFVKEIPLQSKPASPAKSLDAIKQPTLIGAAAIGADQRDYKDGELYKGAYTVRFGLQPADGNHLGSADFPYFAVLIPAKLDTKPDGIADYKTLTKASGILSLRPVSAEEPGLPKLTEPASDHKAVRLTVPGKAGGETVNVVFDLVYVGTGHL